MSGFDKNIKTIVPLLYWLFVVVFIIIFVKAIRLKTSDRTVFDSISNERLIQKRSFYAPKGNIYSYDNVTGELLLLAANEIRYDIYLDLGIGKINAVGEKDKIDWVIADTLWKRRLNDLCSLLSQRFPSKTKTQWEEYLQKNRAERNRGTLIAKMARQDDLDALKNFGKIRNAIFADLKYKRVYPYGDLARRTIGIEYIKDGIDTSNGIEGFYASTLQGSKGERLERKIAPNLWIPIDDTLLIKPKRGNDIITTLDIPLQELAETALKKCLDSNDAKEGCVILMETKTGYIKALASFTRKTLKDRKKKTDQEEKDDYYYYEDRNIAVGSRYEPGSTFKTVTDMMLLDKGYCDTSIIVPTGMKEFPNASKPIYDVNKKGRDKDVSLTRAMEISSNVGISSLVYDYYGQNYKSREQFAKDLQEYFPYKKLETDIMVHEPLPTIGSSRYTDDLLRMSFGYVTAMTPLQLLTFYNGIANGGIMLKPIFVRQVLQDGQVIKTFSADTLKRRMCKPETVKILQDILKRVVIYGTGRRLKSASYGIAGKSGTAEVNYSGGDVKSQHRLHRASFAGYFPADNPQYSCIVVINEPKGGVTHGGDLAAPVFREISDRVMGVNAQRVEETSQNNIAKSNNITSYSTTDKKNRFVDNSVKIKSALLSDKVPDLKGWNLSDALFVLERLGLKVTFSGYGNVKEQSIKPNTKIERGKTIILTLTKK